jgi:hypothetical protein
MNMTKVAKVTPLIQESVFQTRIGSVEVEPEPEIDDDFDQAKSPDSQNNLVDNTVDKNPSEEFDASDYYDEEDPGEMSPSIE